MSSVVHSALGKMEGELGGWGEQGKKGVHGALQGWGDPSCRGHRMQPDPGTEKAAVDEPGNGAGPDRGGLWGQVAEGFGAGRMSLFVLFRAWCEKCRGQGGQIWRAR